jgi:hypothetical protein
MLASPLRRLARAGHSLKTILAHWTAHVASLCRLPRLLRYALATASIYGLCGYGPSGPAPKFAGANFSNAGAVRQHGKTIEELVRMNEMV